MLLKPVGLVLTVYCNGKKIPLGKTLNCNFCFQVLYKFMKQYTIASTTAKHLEFDPTQLPRRSPFGLIQEEFCTDPWKILVVCMMLNMTPGTRVKAVMHQLFQKYPDPNTLLQGSDEDITQMLKPLGLQSKRTKMLKRFSTEFLTLNWTWPNELHGIGTYANDCYRLFCCGETTTVQPTDHALRKYKMWRLNPCMDTEEIRDLIDWDMKRKTKNQDKMKEKAEETTNQANDQLKDNTKSVYFLENENTSLISQIVEMLTKKRAAEEEDDKENVENTEKKSVKKTKTKSKLESVNEEVHIVPNFADWKLVNKVRKSGDTKGRLDFYYIAPNGRKYRSLVEVKRNLCDSDRTEELISEFTKLQNAVRNSVK